MNISWQYLNKHEATISAVKDYNSMKAIITNMVKDENCSRGCPICNNCKKCFQQKRDECLLPHMDNLKKGNNRTRCDHYERYIQAMDFMEWFQPAWNALSEDERETLTLFYLSEQTNKTDAVYSVCDRFFIERSTAYKKKDRAVYHLAVLLYGK